MKMKSAESLKNLIDPLSIREILFVKLSSLGDVVLSSVGMKALKQLFPNSRITHLVESQNASITDYQPWSDQVLIFDRYSLQSNWYKGGEKGLSHLKTVVKSLRRQTYDLAIDMQGLARSAFFVYASRAHLKIGMGRFPLWHANIPHDRTKKTHAVPWYLSLIATLGDISNKNTLYPELVIPTTDLEEARKVYRSLNMDISRPIVVIIHSARAPSRIYPYQYMGEVARTLKQDYQCNVVLLGSPVEIEQGKRVEDAAGCPVYNLTGQTNIKGLASLIAISDAVITSDTGPMHIAVSLDKSVVALFGPSSPAFTGPYGKPEKITLLQSDLECVPCFKNKTECPIGTMQCMYDITPEQVISATVDQLERFNRIQPLL